MVQSQEKSGWRRPWHRWCVLAAGLLQLCVLRSYIQEWRQLAALVSPEELDAAHMGFRCGLCGLLAGIFLGEFLIKSLVSSQRGNRLAEGILLLSLTIAWIVVRAVLPIYWIWWAFYFLLLLCGSIWSFWKYWRNKRSVD